MTRHLRQLQIGVAEVLAVDEGWQVIAHLPTAAAGQQRLEAKANSETHVAGAAVAAALPAVMQCCSAAREKLTTKLTVPCQRLQKQSSY